MHLDSIRIAPYSDQRVSECLELFEASTRPEHRDLVRPRFRAFLRSQRDHGYWVFLQSGVVVACGGAHLSQHTAVATLTWGFSRDGFTRGRVADTLMLARLEYISGYSEVASVRADATQLTKSFYESFGFVECDFIPNRYCAGLDWYDMAFELGVRNRDRIETAMRSGRIPRIGDVGT